MWVKKSGTYVFVCKRLTGKTEGYVKQNQQRKKFPARNFQT